MTHSLGAAGLVLALTMLLPGVVAEEARLLDTTGSGVVPVATETKLRVRGIEGQVYLSRGEAGEVEFRSASLDAEGAEIPVAVWTDGETLRLEPPQGKTTIKALLTVSLPAGMGVRLELERAKVSVSDFDGELAVVGREVQIEAQGLVKPARFDLEGGALNLQAATRGVTVHGRDLAVSLGSISGRTELGLNGGTAKLSGLQSGLLGEFTGTKVTIDTITDTVSLKFVNGSARVARLQDGGEIALSGCQLQLEDAAGELSVVSDSAVRFNDCRAALRIENSAGPVIGVKYDGRLEIKTHDAQVALAQIKGTLRIGGDGLDVKLEQIDATVSVVAPSSSVTVDVATAAVNVESDGGDVRISRAEAQVDLNTHGGNVQLQHLRGPVNIQADAPLVDVGWDVLTSAADSRITNDGGDVTARFPPAGDSRVDATSKMARIENGLEKVRVMENGESAQGVVGDAGRELKTVYIKASGEVKLVGPDAPEPAAEAP